MTPIERLDKALAAGYTLEKIEATLVHDLAAATHPPGIADAMLAVLAECRYRQPDTERTCRHDQATQQG